MDQKKENDGLFLFVDDVDAVERYSVRLNAPTSGNDLMSGDISLDILQARKLVHNANNSGNSEIALENKTINKDEYTVSFFALIGNDSFVMFLLFTLL